MSKPVDYSAVADRFGAAAQAFCSIVESASGKERTDFLFQIYRVLPELIGEAIKLPEVSLSNEDGAEDTQEYRSIPSADLTEEQGHFYNLLKEKLGNWDGYMQVFDPIADNEASFGTLADDIADIYRDVKEGLVLRQRQEVGPKEIIWNWRLLYYSHWGKHAMDALLTIHFRLQDVLE